MYKVGLVGCGAIGSELALAIQKKYSQFARVSFVNDCLLTSAESLKRRLKSKPKIVPLDELVRRSDLIVEAASQDAAVKVIPLAHRYRKKLLVMSVGGILRTSQNIIRNFKGTIYIPSGAIGGIDALLSGSQGKIKNVSIVTRKPLKSLLGAPLFKQAKWRSRKVTKPTVVFSGNAQKAIRLFPQNVNVAATLSLAGIGAAKTKVQVIASPTFKTNSHEIQFDGDFGKVYFLTENIPSKSNPKTSALAINAAIACLEKLFSPIKIGT